MSTSELASRAEGFAQAMHLHDRRKGSGRRSFDAHLEPVAELVRSHGGSPEQVAAALLHDAVEDGGGVPVLEEIELRFGAVVAGIVEDLSDSFVDTTAGQEKEAWILRKARYVDALTGAPARSLEVAVADKFDNARSILAGLEELGERVWSRFNRSDPAAHVWYYTRLAEVFASGIPDHPLTGRLGETVEAIRLASGVRSADVEAVRREAEAAR